MPNPRSAQPFINLNARNNVYKAWGSFLREPLHQWARETYTKAIGLNKHVAFVHSKFLLVDPMGDDPIVVTGSANFSEDSSKENDENMLLIRGDRRVADIYFTEFNRLFNHYYFRSVREATRRVTSGDDAGAAAQNDLQTLFLAETDDWLSEVPAGQPPEQAGSHPHHGERLTADARAAIVSPRGDRGRAYSALAANSSGVGTLRGWGAGWVIRSGLPNGSRRPQSMP